LEVLWYPVLLGQCAVISFGWILAARTSLAAALIVLTISGFCTTGAIGIASTLLVDLYPQSPSTATAALNVTRCIMSAAGTAVVQHIIEAWGVGWTFTFFSFVTIASLPCLWVVMKWGPKWREERFLRLAKREEEKKERKRQIRDGLDGGIISPGSDTRGITCVASSGVVRVGDEKQG